jgi:hypothetical protein
MKRYYIEIIKIFIKISNIPIDKLRKIASEEAADHGANLIKCEKVTSSQNKCIQLVDYVAGASRAKYEEDDDTICLEE